MVSVPPLQVRLITVGGAMALDAGLLEDVQFGSASPGGFTTAACSLSRPLRYADTFTGAYTGFEVIDTRSCEQVWYGRLEDPGRDSSRSGEVRALAAVGGSSHARDVNRPVVYAESRLGAWTRAEESVLSGGTVGVDQERAALLMTLPNGTVVTPSARVVARLLTLRDTGQRISRMRATMTSGRTGEARLRWQFVGRGGPATDANLADVQWGAGPTAMAARLGPDFTTLHTVPEVRVFWTTDTATVPNDNTWSAFADLLVIPTRRNRLNQELTTAASYATDTTVGVLPHAIIEDMLGRFLPEFDKGAAVVDTSLTAGQMQMAYEDGTTAGAILDDLVQLYPTHTWGAWGNERGLGAEFRWEPWPTDVALSGLDTGLDTFSAPSSAADLYNEVRVRYKDAGGQSRMLLVQGDCPALTEAGLVRCGMLDLGSQIGNTDTAQAAGVAFLAAHQYPTNSGTIKVRRPIRDALSGRVLQPWQIRAGVLCRVRNLYPRPDDLNTYSNGETVFRVSAVSYSTKDNEATLSLDSYSRSVSTALARLARAQARTRRV